MTGLRDLLKKKESIAKEAQQSQPAQLVVPEFKIIRTTTESEEVIEPPYFPDDDVPVSTKANEQKKEPRRTLGFRRSSNVAHTKDPSASRTSLESEENKPKALPVRPKNERRLSERLGLCGRARSKSNDAISSHLPEDLPAAPDSVAIPTIAVDGADDERSKAEQAREQARKEAQWEKRATILASSNKLLEEEQQRQAQTQQRPAMRDRSQSISDQHGDENIQEAIRLHESGDLEKSTQMFGRLANPKGANNALSQVLYGLALRHGWGIPPEPEKAIHYLSLAASNSAAVEQAALAAGMTKGGAAKGELVLAIFELANCFRHGWGVKKDALAARQYYETAANLGDTDAMEEAAWCYTEGFGGAKDKVSRLRLRTLFRPPDSNTIMSRHQGRSPNSKHRSTALYLGPPRIPASLSASPRHHQ